MHELSERSPRVLVVGDLMVDHYIFGSSDRVSSEAPIPIVEVQQEKSAPGGAANVVNNLRALGAQVAAASVVGCDATGGEVLDMLNDRCVSTKMLLVQEDRLTPRKTRVVVGNQQIVRFDRESREPIQETCRTQLLDSIRCQIREFDLILLSDYDKGVLTRSVSQQIIGMARQESIPVLADPSGSDPRKYIGATLVTPNEKEASRLAGIAIRDEPSLEQAGRILIESLGLQHAVITLSEQGLAVFGESTIRIRALAKDVYDVSGAGDTVLATLGFCMACGLPVADAARLANRAAGIVVRKRGVATVTWEEIAGQDVEAQGDLWNKRVCSADEIEVIVRKLRRQGKRVVFTNGCFDLLHRGHVEYLRASRAHGDVLIVGINSDASVRNNKGPQRPIVPEADRVSMLNALRVVDYVVLFDEDTPEALVQRIRPDVLTKGADYEGKQVVGSEIAREVHLIQLVEGRSTSSTIERVKRAA